MLASMALGGLAVVALPREEEPQIVVPMVDVFVEMPGATPADVEQRVTRPMEQLLSGSARRGIRLLDLESRAVDGRRPLQGKRAAGSRARPSQSETGRKCRPHPARRHRAHRQAALDRRCADHCRHGVVDAFRDDQLRSLAVQLRDAIAEVNDVSEVTVIGGRPRQVRVDIDPAKLSAYDLNPLSVQQAIARTNVRDSATGPVSGGVVTSLEAGSRLRTADELRNTVVTSASGRPVFVRDVAEVVDGDAEPSSYVTFQSKASGAQPAVTIAVAKRKGTNATDVAHRVVGKLDTLKGSLVPPDVHLTITRDYGETAADKSNELLWHMALSVLSVSALIWLVLGRREAAVVLIAIPVTLALTLFMFYLYGYTLNRITLFALIFSIGILVDDAIVVVENIVRHARMSGARRSGLAAIAIRRRRRGRQPHDPRDTRRGGGDPADGVHPRNVGTLHAADPRGRLGGDGLLAGGCLRRDAMGRGPAARAPPAHHDHGEEDLVTRLYRRVMGPLIASGRRRAIFLAGVAALLLAAVALVPLELVRVKMMPFDNKNEFQVVSTCPRARRSRTTARVASATGVGGPGRRDGRQRPAVRGRLGALQLQRPRAALLSQARSAPRRSAGEPRAEGRTRGAEPRCGRPRAPAPGADRETIRRNHPGGGSCRRARPCCRPSSRKSMGRIRRGGWPWLPQSSRSSSRPPAWSIPTGWSKPRIQRSRSPSTSEKAAAAGLSAAAVAAVVRMAGSGESAGLLHDERAREDVPIVIRLPRGDRSLEAVQSIRLRGSSAEALAKAGTRPVAVGELTSAVGTQEEPSLYHKNLQAVTYVTGDLAGANGSPVYAIMQMNKPIGRLSLPEGYQLEVFNAVQPFDTSRYAMKWDGEWHLTIEVFRDLGLAFAAVLVLIYVLVVGWFQSFKTPLLIMAAIPFSLVGILPAHAAMGAFFTATSMIGFIAGAGIVVRNSIILVDFIELRLLEGLPLEQAVVDAGAVRFRPMALTAAAMIVGAAVILFDPIFQGLAISLMAGEMASLLLSRMAVPVLYYMAKRHERSEPVAAAAPMEAVA